ncbi:HAD family hydrolase [Brevibacillus sp. SYP-B805]|uniref:HAD family hydrolase n=1 Tax=Brevibacillus sp. SYP-B805 TaxID=1578199 RepID=UPI0013ED74EB|nr:HAD family hydrolase [Brevibacillus sp. SYP-B805]NGQ96457.1 HAD family hydrolase [Brevibacillus sp. SYP-B805]
MGWSDVRLVAFDMDGTLLNEASQMTEETQEACRLLQATGRKLILSTGRTYVSARLPVHEFPFDGYVCSNGAAIYEKDGTLVHSTILPAGMVTEAIRKIRELPIYYEIHDTDSNRWMADEDRQRIDVENLSELRRFTFYKLSRVAPLEELIARLSSGEINAVKIFIWSRQAEQLQWVREQLAPYSNAAALTSSGDTNVEVMPKDVSKWTGLQYFLAQWKLTPEQVLAFGDADNDLDILSNVGHPVAMENATPALKRIARHVAGHHDKDGVASFIRAHLL